MTKKIRSPNVETLSAVQPAVLSFEFGHSFGFGHSSFGIAKRASTRAGGPSLARAFSAFLRRLILFGFGLQPAGQTKVSALPPAEIRFESAEFYRDKGFQVIEIDFERRSSLAKNTGAVPGANRDSFGI